MTRKQPLRFLSVASIELTAPTDAKAGQTILTVCEVTDNGTPPLTRYQRVIMTVGQ